MHPSLTAGDLAIVLALVRGRSLAAAGERLRVDSSTVFRALQRLERQLGQSLFSRSRNGYSAQDLALRLADLAEQMEGLLDSARSEVEQARGEVMGTVRLTTTDSLMQDLLVPALIPLRESHPGLVLDLTADNQPANLTRRDADIAVRATRRPPPHLVGRHLGVIRMAVMAAPSLGYRTMEQALTAGAGWVAPDDALPDHPSVVWRRRHLPSVTPVWRVSSLLTVKALVAAGAGIGVLPLFMAGEGSGLICLTDPLDDSQTDLWLLTHPDMRHLRRISTVYRHLSETLRLPEGTAPEPASEG